MPKALIAVTSAAAPFYSNGTQPTGAFITEILHPYNVLRAAGFDIDLVSETGEYTPDWLSLQPDWLPAEDRAVYEDHASEFRKKLDKLLTPAAVTAAGTQYDVFFASGGHASLLDYPTASGLQELAAAVHARGGIVGAVCHGGALLPGVINKKTGRSIIDGHRVTGFTTAGEIEHNVLGIIRDDWHAVPIEESAAGAGATCMYAS